MIEEQEPLPDVPEPDEPYRRPVEKMSLSQVEGELCDQFGVALLYLLVPIFLVAISTTTVVATPFFVRVLPAVALVFVSYWVLQKAFRPMYQADPEAALLYLRIVSRLGGGIMSTPHNRVLALSARRGELRAQETPEA